MRLERRKKKRDLFIFLHKYKETPVHPGTNNGNDTWVQSKEWDFERTSPEEQDKGQLSNGPSLREFLKAEGQGTPAAREGLR